MGSTRSVLDRWGRWSYWEESSLTLRRAGSGRIRRQRASFECCNRSAVLFCIPLQSCGDFGSSLGERERGEGIRGDSFNSAVRGSCGGCPNAESECGVLCAELRAREDKGEEREEIAFSRIEFDSAPISAIRSPTILRLSFRPTLVLAPTLFRLSSTLSSKKLTRFTPLFRMALDLAPLAARLAALSLTATPAPASTATALNTYFFRPKTGSKHPENDKLDLSLIVVAVEQGKDVGSAAAVAKSAGLKDMRAIAGDAVHELIGRKREEGQSSYLVVETLLTTTTNSAASVLSLPPALTPHTLVLTSSTLGALTLLVPSPTNPTETIQLSAAEWNTVVAGLKSEGAAVKELEFFVKVAGAPSVVLARFVLWRELTHRYSAPVSAPKEKKAKGPAPPKKETSKKDVDGVAGVQLGITVTKNQADFGEWYSQAS